MLSRALYIIVAFCSGITVGNCQSDVTSKIEAVENNLTGPEQFKDTSLRRFNIYERMEFYKVPAVTIAIIYRGRIDWTKTYGLADIERKIPATDSTRFQAASLAKSVNAMCVMKLVEMGKLSLDSDIRSYLKTWTIPENKYSKGHKITIAQLLSHTSGFGVHGFLGYRPGKPLPTTNQILDGKKPANNRRIKPEFKPGTKFQYSGGGSLVVLGKILSDNVSDNYDSLAKAMILKPAGMFASTYEENIYAPEFRNFASGTWKGRNVPGNSFIYPAPTGLWTTSSDLAKFIIALTNSYNGKPGALLDSSLARRMFTIPPNGKQYGLGIGIIDVGADKYIQHSGANEGFRAWYACSFSGEVGAVIMTNSESNAFINELINGILFVYKWKGITSYAGM